MIAPYQLSVVPSVFRDFDRLMDTFADFHGFEPTRDVQETEDAFIVSFDMPGVKRDAIKVEVKGSQLLIQSERQRPQRPVEKFERAFTLPESVDDSKIEVNYEDGVLSLLLPKAVAAKPRTIEIQSVKGGFFSKLLPSN
jgi:HSP20 family protein